ncbi:MAG: flagellar M-ring protein FliF [Oscillospiraceae bacterium]|nr:flagellar M-ring protein FliF [Oscillospiraceae bacterium]
MNEKLKKTLTVVKDKWTGFSSMVKVLIISVPVAVVAIIIILTLLLNHKSDAVLYSGVSTSEAQEISAAIMGLGVTDVSINTKGDIIVPEDQVDYLRMQLAVQGYPKSGTTYDIYNDGIDLWSTDADKREVQRQQREARLEATLRQLDAVQAAVVNLDIPETKDYVIVQDKGVPTCSITITLRSGKELTNSEVRAIYSLVTKSVDGLINDNVSLIDTLGREYDWISEEEERSGITDQSGTLVGMKRLQFQREYREAIMDSLKSFFDPIFGENGYSVNVSAILNYDSMKQTSTEYIPVNEDTPTGVLDHDQVVVEGAKLDEENGLVGVTPNADESPDYPTYVGLEDGQSYYYSKNEHQYDVSNIVTEIERDGYAIDKLSVALMINTNSLTDREREDYAGIVANAAGTTVDNVSVFNTVFALPGASGTGGNGGSGGLVIDTRPSDPYRDIMLYAVIVLGVLLIMLIIISMFMSNSRKRKIRRRQEQAFAAAAGGNIGAGASGEALPVQETPAEVDFNIASLTEEAGKDSRETILKREITEFSKTSPEIVASIIRNMLREE